VEVEGKMGLKMSGFSIGIISYNRFEFVPFSYLIPQLGCAWPASIMLENLPIMLSGISQKSSLLCPNIS